MPRKICVVTGSRADYGLLFWVMKEIQADPKLVLQLCATGMHLSPEFGSTYRVIEQDGFVIDAAVESLMSSDTPAGIAKSVGLGVIGFADAFSRLRPDIVLVLGDRFEIFAAAQAALFANIPIAHIAGGDTTEGAVDETLRHGITKMAQLHFVTNEVAAQRVKQLGENPEHVYNTGSPGIDFIKRLKLLDRHDLERELDMRFRARTLLITFHPETLAAQPPSQQFQALLDALDSLEADQFSLIFTKPNADRGGREIIGMIDSFCAIRSHAKAFTSLGQLRYLSLVPQASAVVGNSSSGLYEVPSFGVPTVNIGDRQAGRLAGRSVIHCAPSTDEIEAAIRKALQRDCRGTQNPYGDGESARRIVSVLSGLEQPAVLLKKRFFDLGGRDNV